MTHLHLVEHIDHLGGEHLSETPIFGIVRRHTAELVLDHIRDLLAELGVILFKILFVLILADDKFILFRHNSTLI